MRNLLIFPILITITLFGCKEEGTPMEGDLEKYIGTWVWKKTSWHDSNQDVEQTIL